MNNMVSLLSDLAIILFDMVLYVHLTALRKDDFWHRFIMYTGVCVITVAYSVAAYVLRAPYGISSFVCMTIPSFLLFFCLSKYKSARFLVTFCFVDTVTLILASLGKIGLIVGGKYGEIVSFAILLIVCTATYAIARPYFPRYRELMEQVSQGWGSMALSTVLIYILLIFFSAYPKPLMARLEYLPTYLLLCVTILSFYAVFILLILQKVKLTKANRLLQEQHHWQTMAYVDELTNLANAAAYTARTAEIEKKASAEIPCSVTVLDIDEFKKVNDTHGHLYGNEVLKKTAEFFRASFPKEYYEFFRVGGDEFVAISTGISQEKIEEDVWRINTMVPSLELECTCSCGYAMVDFTAEKPFEEAFRQADQAMYAVKTEKKAKLRNASHT